MKPNQINGESRIETLKNNMERCIERKDHEIRKLEKKIAEAEKILERIHSNLRGHAESLKRRRARREVEETKCFEAISRIHKEISKIAA